MYYDFVPMPERKPLKWPNGARVAVLVTFNLEYWDLTKDTDEHITRAAPPFSPIPCPAMSPIFLTSPGANMASASVSGVCSTSPNVQASPSVAP